MVGKALTVGERVVGMAEGGFVGAPKNDDGPEVWLLQRGLPGGKTTTWFWWNMECSSLLPLCEISPRLKMFGL
jgi:hypothetical protein